MTVKPKYTDMTERQFTQAHIYLHTSGLIKTQMHCKQEHVSLTKPYMANHYFITQSQIFIVLILKIMLSISVPMPSSSQGSFLLINLMKRMSMVSRCVLGDQ